MNLFERKSHLYYKGLIPSKLPRDFIFCFGSNSTGDHGPITAELALKHFGAQMGVASGGQGQSYGIVTIALQKGATDPRTGITYNEHYLTPEQIKANFKDLYDYARKHPSLTFVVYARSWQSQAWICPQRVRIHLLSTCKPLWVVCGIPRNVVFEDHFDKVVRQGLYSSPYPSEIT